jgi:hypothetical protein
MVHCNVQRRTLLHPDSAGRSRDVRVACSLRRRPPIHPFVESTALGLQCMQTGLWVFSLQAGAGECDITDQRLTTVGRIPSRLRPQAGILLKVISAIVRAICRRPLPDGRPTHDDANTPSTCQANPGWRLAGQGGPRQRRICAGASNWDSAQRIARSRLHSGFRHFAVSPVAWPKRLCGEGHDLSVNRAGRVSWGWFSPRCL